MHVKLSRRQWGLATLFVALATLITLNWKSLLIATAVATSDKRPDLLSDAEWGKPETARAFGRRFHAGVPEADLLSWLHANGFNVDPMARRANLTLRGVPCAEIASISWAAEGGQLSRGDAVVTEAGCL
ncbi:MAG: hypothetical protein M3R03_09990 [Pseudomonadota bacterium]|nr:hypothetical protein [Pseudomonadota bacterium]